MSEFAKGMWITIIATLGGVLIVMLISLSAYEYSEISDFDYHIITMMVGDDPELDKVVREYNASNGMITNQEFRAIYREWKSRRMQKALDNASQ